MAVHVDGVRHAYLRAVMCHMWADDDAKPLEIARREDRAAARGACENIGYDRLIFMLPW